MIISIYLLLICYISRVAECQRRIHNGYELMTDKHAGYMVYLLEAQDYVELERKYNNWLCGGAIVTESYVLTSAACVEDVNFMIVVFAADKYMTYESILEHKECYKKVIEFCVPKNYEFSFQKLEKWSNLDIALAKVDSPFPIKNKQSNENCPHTPKIVPMNFYEEFQKTGIDVIVFGWGSNKTVRQETDDSDHNSPILLTTTSRIINKKDCIEVYKTSNVTKDYMNIIEKYMICTNDLEGRIEHDGSFKDNDANNLPELDGCIDESDPKLRSQCIEDVMTRLGLQGQNTLDDTRRQEMPTRHGICQNDHGGPLVTWIGSQAYIIGVASVFLTDKDNFECMGPYLFTSTYCSSGFLRCALNEDVSFMMREFEMKPDFSIPNKLKHNSKTNKKSVQKKQKTITKQPNKSEESPWSGPFRFKNTTKAHNFHVTSTHAPEDKNVSDDDYDILSYLNLLRGGPDLDEFCKQPDKERGFKIIKRRISWIGHSRGPADNER